MRIGVATWTNGLAGGVEMYLASVIPALQHRGHEVAILHEVEASSERGRIVSAAAVPQWSAERSPDAALESLRSWKPDVVFANGLESAELERRTIEIAPSVFFAHAYRGTCVSGTKAFRRPGWSTCTRTLGWPCLVQYLPRGCGGSSAVTMVRLYRRESERRELLGGHSAVVAFSEHIREEYVRHGVPRARTHVLPGHVGSATPRVREAAADAAHRILFIGRMEALKGGELLLDALPIAERILGRPFHARFVGDGRERARLETLARGRSGIEFTGWVSAAERDRFAASADLLVVPSVWPEPFGLVGIETASFGVPAAAFDVGGINQWLKDGVNGHLAAADPPSAESLADAIVKCLKDPAHYARLVEGAFAMASKHTLPAHVSALESVFAAAARTARCGESDDPAA